MTNRDPLQCTFEEARRVNLRQGIALNTHAKIAFFEEMMSFAVRFGARDRLAASRVREVHAPNDAGTGVSP